MNDADVTRFFDHLADEIWKVAYRMIDILGKYIFYIIAFALGIRIIRMLLRGDSVGTLIIVIAIGCLILGLITGRINMPSLF